MAGICRVMLLGRFVVEVRGRVVPARAWNHEADAVVKALAVEPRHALPRDQITARLWPELPARAAHKRLTKAAEAACLALGSASGVTIDGDVVRLWPTGALEVDLLRFEVLAKHVGTERGAREALELYVGELLPDDVDRPWTEPYRRRATETRLRLLARVGELPGVIDLDHTERLMAQLRAARAR